MDDRYAMPDYLQMDGCSYRIRPLARGGCAQTYVGEPASRGAEPRLVFKVPHRKVLANDHGFRQWQQECALLCGLRHPAIPRVVALRSTPIPFLAYPYLAGATMRSVLGQTRFSREAAMAITIALLRVLEYLHRLHTPIAHGDVRPENILLDHDGNVRLIDFGCARHFGHQTPSPWIAAPKYLSPEQARGLPWDSRSDIYQAGLFLHEFIAGHPYNDSANARQAILRAASPPAFAHAKLRARAGTGICYWLEDALQPDPRSRIPDASRAADLLLDLLGERRVHGNTRPNLYDECRRTVDGGRPGLGRQ